MGLLKKKDILVAKQFKHFDDPFFADNQVLKTTDKNQLPSQGSDILVAKSQAVFFTVDNILNKLLANDVFISQYLSKIMAGGITRERAEEAFDQDYDISSMTYFEDKYKEHFDTYHNSRKHDVIQLSTVYGNYMHDDFSNINIEGAKKCFVTSSFMELDDDRNVFVMSSDVLVSCEFDDSEHIKYPTNYVNVQVMNEHTGNKFSYTVSKGDASEIVSQIPQTSDSKYIYKEWLSGLKELLIYIPSTFTFYNENPEAPGQDPRSKQTWIRLIINKRHFKLNHIYNMQICGQSLPLQIHDSYFNDCPQPSLVRTMCVSDQLSSNVGCVYDDNTNMFTLYFCCYGTDAQAIQLFCD